MHDSPTPFVVTALVALALFACDDAQNGAATRKCANVVQQEHARANTDATSQCRACCLAENALRGHLKADACVCQGRAANSGLDRESQ